MRLKIRFGDKESKEVEWDKEVSSFPKIINYSHRNYEWVFYDTDLQGNYAYVLTFCELAHYDPNYNVVSSSWEDLFGHEPNNCQCGSAYDRHSPNGHYSYCDMWRRD